MSKPTTERIARIRERHAESVRRGTGYPVCIADGRDTDSSMTAIGDLLAALDAAEARVREMERQLASRGGRPSSLPPCPLCGEPGCIKDAGQHSFAEMARHSSRVAGC